MKEISQLEDKDKIMELPISYEEKGIKKGIGKGIEKGRQLERLEVARDMLQEGLSLEVISKVTKLTKEEIKKLK